MLTGGGPRCIIYTHAGGPIFINLFTPLDSIPACFAPGLVTLVNSTDSSFRSLRFFYFFFFISFIAISFHDVRHSTIRMPIRLSFLSRARLFVLLRVNSPRRSSSAGAAFYYSTELDESVTKLNCNVRYAFAFATTTTTTTTTTTM